MSYSTINERSDIPWLRLGLWKLPQARGGIKKECRLLCGWHGTKSFLLLNVQEHKEKRGASERLVARDA